MKEKIIESVKVSFDTKGCTKITKYTDGSIRVEPITAEEASQLYAEQGYEEIKNKLPAI